MIALYERLTRACRTVNQLNRVHIALENRMTPAEWRDLQPWLANLPTPDGGEDDLLRNRRQWAASIQALFACARKPAPEPFVRTRLQANMQYFRAPGATPAGRTLVVCFTGIAQRLFAPSPVILQQFDAARVDLVVIRDPHRAGYMAGLPGVADDFDTFVSRLGDALPHERYDKVVAFGTSGGGLPAILAAWRLWFDAVVTFGCGNPEDRRWTQGLGHPLGDIIRRTAKRPPVPTWLVFGADSEPDKAAAVAVNAYLPIRRVEVRGKDQPVGHNCLYPLLLSGALPGFLSDVIDDAKQSTPAVSATPPRADPTPLPVLDGPKIVCIGFNKTGTTTIGRCFDALGIGPVAEPRSRHADFLALSESIVRFGDFEPAIKAAAGFRAFQDRPWNIWDMYRRLDERFEGSLFILTERSPESWWDSVERWLTISHREDAPRWKLYFDHLRVDRLDRAAFIDAYNRYNDGVKTYFAGRDNLLVMNLEAGDGWDPLCRFLDRPVPNRPFPHANRQRARSALRG